MHRRYLAVLAAVAVLLAGVAPAAVAADDTTNEDDGFFDDLVSVESGGLAETLAREVAEATGWVARATDMGGDETADDYAAETTDEFNSHSGTLEEYASDRLTATTDYDAIRVDFHDKDGGNVSRYVVADVENGSWSNTRMVTPDEFESLNRTTDHYVSLDWFASKHAADELEAFTDEYAAPDENASSSYQTKMVGEYGSGLESDMWNASD